MSTDLLVPIVASIAWLILAGVGFASFRLKWSQMLMMAIAWIVIFGGVFLVVEWFLVAQGTASALM